MSIPDVLKLLDSTVAVNLVVPTFDTVVRYRYESEGKETGGKLSCGKQSPVVIQVNNCQPLCKYLLSVSCMSASEPFKLHPHKLVGKDLHWCGSLFVELDGSPDYKVNLDAGIQSVKQDFMSESLKGKLLLLEQDRGLDPFTPVVPEMINFELEQAAEEEEDNEEEEDAPAKTRAKASAKQKKNSKKKEFDCNNVRLYVALHLIMSPEGETAPLPDFDDKDFRYDPPVKMKAPKTANKSKRLKSDENSEQQSSEARRSAKAPAQVEKGALVTGKLTRKNCTYVLVAHHVTNTIINFDSKLKIAKFLPLCAAVKDPGEMFIILSSKIDSQKQINVDFSNNKDFVNSPEYNLWAETVPVRTRHGQTLVINIPSFGGVFSCATASTEQVNEENCGPQLAYIRVNCITSRAGNAGQQLLSVCTDPMEFIYLPVFKEHQETVSKIRKKSLRNNDSFNRVMNEVSGDCNESAPCADDIKGRLKRNLTERQGKITHQAANAQLVPADTAKSLSLSVQHTRFTFDGRQALVRHADTIPKSVENPGRIIKRSPSSFGDAHQSFAQPTTAMPFTSADYYYTSTAEISQAGPGYSNSQPNAMPGNYAEYLNTDGYSQFSNSQFNPVETTGAQHWNQPQTSNSNVETELASEILSYFDATTLGNDVGLEGLTAYGQQALLNPAVATNVTNTNHNTDEMDFSTYLQLNDFEDVEDVLKDHSK